MELREAVERILHGQSEGDASEMVQGAMVLIDFLLRTEGMLARKDEREAIQVGLVELGMAVEHVRLGHPGPSKCADCGSDNCCKTFAEGMEV